MVGMFTQGSTDPAIQHSAVLIMIQFEPPVREMGMQDKHTVLKIKVLHDANEEPFCLNGSIKNLYHLKNLSVSQKFLCDERRFFRL